MTAEAPIDRATLLAALDGILDPKSGQGLNAAGLVRGLILAPGRAGFMLEVPAGEVDLYTAVRDEAEALIASLPGVTRAQVVLTAEASQSPSTSKSSPKWSSSSRRLLSPGRPIRLWKTGSGMWRPMPRAAAPRASR